MKVHDKDLVQLDMTENPDNKIYVRPWDFIIKTIRKRGFFYMNEIILGME